MDQFAFCLAPIVGDGPVDAPRFAFTARNSVANAEDSDDGLFLWLAVGKSSLRTAPRIHDTPRTGQDREEWPLWRN